MSGFIKTIPLTILSATPSVTNVIAVDASNNPLSSVSKNQNFGVQVTLNAKPVTLSCSVKIDGAEVATKSIAGAGATDSNKSVLQNYSSQTLSSGISPGISHPVSVSCTNNPYTGTGNLSLNVMDLPPAVTGKPAVLPATGNYNNIQYSCDLSSLTINPTDDSLSALTQSFVWTSGSTQVGTGQNFNCTPDLCKINSPLVCALTVSDPSANSVSQSSDGVIVKSRLLASISANKSISTQEGAVVTFSPTVTGGTNLTYAWDFGDGNTQSTSQQTVTHKYYKLGSGTSVYHANLSVADDQKNTATDSVDVTVKDASLFIKVEEPSQEQRFARMVSVNPMKIKVSLKDVGGSPIGGGSVVAGIAGNKIALNETQSGTYEGNYLPKWDDDYSNTLSIDANAAVNGIPKQTSDNSTLVYFDRTNFDVNVVEPSQSVFATQRIPEVKFVFFYSDKSAVSDINVSNVKAIWEPTGNEILLRRDGNFFIGDLNHYLPIEDDVKNGMKLTLSAADRVRNILGSTGSKILKFNVTQFNSGLNLKVLSPANPSENFAYGQKARFEALLASSASASQESVFLSAVEARLDVNFSFDRNSGKWFAEVRMPSESAYSGNSLSLSIGASAVVDGQRILAKPVNIAANLSSMLEVQLVNPNPDNGSTSTLSELRASVSYPDGSQYDANSLKMKVNGKEIQFVKKGDFFVANYTLNTGSQEFSIVPLVEGFESKGLKKTVEVKGPAGIDPLLLAGIAVAIIIVLLVFYLVISKRTAKLHTEIAKVKGERSVEEWQQTVKEMEAVKKNLERDYMKTRISEDEYRKRLVEYTAKQAEAEAKIKVLLEKGSGQEWQSGQQAPAKQNETKNAIGFAKPKIVSPPWIARNEPKEIPREADNESKIKSERDKILKQMELKDSGSERQATAQTENPHVIEVEFRKEDGKGSGVIEVIEMNSVRAPSEEENAKKKLESILNKVESHAAGKESDHLTPVRLEKTQAEKKPRSGAGLDANSKVTANELVEQYKSLVHKYNAEDLRKELVDELGYSDAVADEVIARLKPRK